MNTKRFMVSFILIVLVVNMTASVFMPAFAKNLSVDEIADFVMENLFEIDSECLDEEDGISDAMKRRSSNQNKKDSDNDVEESLYDAIFISNTMRVEMIQTFVRVKEEKTVKIDNLDEFKIEAYV